MKAPAVSVIIPTHNRGETIRRVLDGLSRQTFPARKFEVVVVADGCTDETPRIVRSYRAAFSLRLIEQKASGPAVARNTGAAKARGSLLIFLDDDVEPSALLVQAYHRIHQGRPKQVAVGYLPPYLAKQTGFFRVQLRAWWEAMFARMRERGYRYTYSDLLSGNFSVSSALFAKVGGFNPAFRCHEDYELGWRLSQVGASFAFAADAWAYHHEVTDLARSLQRKYSEGRADVALARMHPALRPVLPLRRFNAFAGRLDRGLHKLAFKSAWWGDLMAKGLLKFLAPLEWLRFRRTWRTILDGLLGYWYWRGVAEEFPTRQALLDLYSEAAKTKSDPKTAEAGQELEVNLKNGLKAAEELLEAKRPTCARLLFGGQYVAKVVPQPGEERLGGAHLRRILATDLAWPLLKAMALEQAFHSTRGNSTGSAMFPKHLSSMAHGHAHR